jgi:hypothetical protein
MLTATNLPSQLIWLNAFSLRSVYKENTRQHHTAFCVPNCEINHILAWFDPHSNAKKRIKLPSQHALIIAEICIPAQEICTR